MFDILYTIAAFLVAISLLIAIHEFGHFWVAKRLGVKVLRYSIGFGKPLWKRCYGPDQTEYVIASLPLGGYVRMLDEHEGEVAETETHRAFNRQALWKRFAIVFAGPAFNFIFAIVAYWLMFVIGVAGIKPVVGEVSPDSPAARAGLMPEQEIVSINNQLTPIWDVAMHALLPALIDKEQIDLAVRDKNGLSFNYHLDLSDVEAELEPDNIFQILGFTPWRPYVRPVIGEVVKDSAAERAGITKGDRIISINNKRIKEWGALVDYVSARPDADMNVLIDRNGKEITVKLHTQSTQVKAKTIGRMGVAPLERGRYPDEMRIVHGYSMFTAIGKSLNRTWDNSILMLKMLGKILVGEVSVKNLSGPLNIAVYAGYSASAGLPRFLDFLAIVSVSLGILNLLPIPILDGGHLMYYFIEFVKGSPVSERTEIIGQKIGIALLILLMSLAFYNDLVRLLG